MRISMGNLLAAGLLLAACNQQQKDRTEVSREVDDLREAEHASPKVAHELEQQLAAAKADVVRLEKELALAKQGITKDVIEEREELKDALKKQEKHVREEISEAKHAADVHTTEAERARQELERAQPPQQVEAEVHTETRTIPAQKQVEVQTEQTNVPMQNTRVRERSTQSAQAPATDTTAGERAAETPIDTQRLEQERAARRSRSAGAAQPNVDTTTP